VQLKDLGEFKLIKHLSKIFAQREGPVKLGIGDDSAVLEYGGRYILLSVDAFVEGVHFTFSHISPADLGKRCLICAASDIWAMGGLPEAAFLTLGAGEDTELELIDSFAKGIEAAAEKLKIQVSGGDTVKSPTLFISLAVIGSVEKDCLIKRCGAKAGDLIAVTGRIGEAKALLEAGKLGIPPIRFEVARALAKVKLPTAMIDISDGLLQDLSHLLEPENLGAILYEEKLPLSPLLEQYAWHVRLRYALEGGEDYELLFTFNRAKEDLLREISASSGTQISIIGRITKEAGIKLVRKDGKLEELEVHGYDHFKE